MALQTIKSANPLVLGREMARPATGSDRCQQHIHLHLWYTFSCFRFRNQAVGSHPCIRYQRKFPATDKSDTADNSWQPISYFSRKLKPAETQYSTFNQELLAVYPSIHYFRYFVEGCLFHVLTDFKLLTFSL